MELKITEFFKNAEPYNLSASQMEMGQNAGKITWNNALDSSPDFWLLDTAEKRDKFRKDLKGYGAWDEQEIASWSDTELNALFLQFIASEMRECGLADQYFEDIDWEDYESSDNAGRIFKGIDGEIYYGMGG
jgi:hypothetical protein